MARLIDQRILIPAPADAIWGILADQYQLPRWRVDCQSVSILSTRQFGTGTRIRCTPPRGKDKIEEIIAWYEGLGYEYILAESNRYSVWSGRLRLQAVPEGTIVQWTITFQPRGLFHRLRTALGGAGRIEADTANSLRGLYHLVDSLGHRITGEQRRGPLMKPVQKIVRSASQPIVVPGTDAKADTQPRRPPDLDAAIRAADSQPSLNLHPTPKKPIPAVTVLNTESGLPSARPTVPSRDKLEESQPGMATVGAVSQKDDEIVSDDEKTSPQTIVSRTAKVEDQEEPTRKPDLTTRPGKLPEESRLPPGMPESLKVTPPKGTPAVDVSRLRYADEVASEKKITQESPIVEFPPGGRELPPPTAATDTGQISIWQAFGVPAPSQVDSEALNEVVKIATSEHAAVLIEPPLTEADTRTFSPLALPDSSVLRVRAIIETPGLRKKQARAGARLRIRD